MDLTKYGRTPNSEEELLSLWWYQPFQFAENISAGVQPSWFMRGFDRSIVKREQNFRHFRKFQALSLRAARMYQDWADALIKDSGVDLSRASVFDLACNAGYFLYWLKERGAEYCVGIDQADLTRQRAILNGITRIDSIDFRKGRWNPDHHAIEGLQPDERFDLVICSAFMLHISDPLHLLAELGRRTGRALLLHTHVGWFNPGLRIKYAPAAHHQKWGDRFPNTFDTQVSRKLLLHGLKECGFRKVRELRYSRAWLPWRWYKPMTTMICVK